MKLLYVDESMLVYNKMSGIATVPGSWDENSHSLKEVLENEYGKLWIVHRLDKVTSGVVVFARNGESHRLLSLLFEKHSLSKTYHAILCGVPEWNEYTAQHRLLANVGHKHRTTIDLAHGKPAATHFHILETFHTNVLVEAHPETGRTHQIRVHAATLGYPILADIQYGATPTDLISRSALHAYSLTFELKGKPYRFSAPYPDDFDTALIKLRADK